MLSRLVRADRHLERGEGAHPPTGTFGAIQRMRPMGSWGTGCTIPRPQSSFKAIAMEQRVGPPL